MWPNLLFQIQWNRIQDKGKGEKVFCLFKKSTFENFHGLVDVRYINYDSC